MFATHQNIQDKQERMIALTSKYRDLICTEFEKIETEKGSNAKFQRKSWDREGGGGGVMSLMRGEIFEKAGVNISAVWGKFSEKFAKEIPGCDGETDFWASGISLVAHMANPKVPAVHLNTRMIVTKKLWFGGGSDLTPTFEYKEDTELFHRSLKSACDKHDMNYYPKFKEECDKYFFIPHRNEPRGVGGIFFDNLNTGDWEADFNFIQSVLQSFLDVYPEIVRKRMNETFTQSDKEAQLYKRGRYAEFNLVYDRGTRFGFMTGGNTEAILMSLPPECKW